MSASVSKVDGDDWEALAGRNAFRLGLWTLAWVLTVALASMGPKLLWGMERVGWSVAAIGLNVAVGVGMIAANKTLVMQMDELQQRIQLEAMGLTLGFALVAGLGYSLLDIANVVSFDAEITHLVAAMGLFYTAMLWGITRRYR